MSLGDILEQEIQGEITQIRAGAQEKAAQIVSEAQERAQNLVDSRKRALETDYAAGLTRARSAADLDSNAQRLAASDTLQVKAFQTAQQFISSMVSAPEYPQVLTKLISEGLDALPTAEVIETSAAEQDAVRQALAGLGRDMDVRVNDTVKTGVRLLGSGGKTSVQNTLLGRLEAARPTLSAEVSRMLAES